jgi:hypothetical protein
MPVRVPTGPVFANKCVVFALDDFNSLAALSSSMHSIWVIRYTGTMRPTSSTRRPMCFLHFPAQFPHPIGLGLLGPRPAGLTETARLRNALLAFGHAVDAHAPVTLAAVEHPPLTAESAASSFLVAIPPHLPVPRLVRRDRSTRGSAATSLGSCVACNAGGFTLRTGIRYRIILA